MISTRLLLQRAWLKRGGIAHCLWPLSVIYGALFTLRRMAYGAGWLDTKKFDVPVVVVGNVVVGGTGKTPLVIALAAHWTAQGLKVGVVSRGYGRQATHAMEVLIDTPAAQSGDEPALIKRSSGVPVFVAAKRTEAVQALLRSYPSTDVIVCDDGLQHHALHRDIEIAVFDDRGLGNNWLLPAGLLREPWPRTRHRAPCLVIHTGDSPQFAGYTSRRRLAEHGTTPKGDRILIASLRNQAVSALAAIASPDAFFEMLKASGLRLQQTLPLPDHFAFPDGLAGLGLVGGDRSTTLCTEKDAVKLFLAPIGDRQLVAVPLICVPEPAFLQALDAQLNLLRMEKRSQVPSTDGP